MDGNRHSAHGKLREEGYASVFVRYFLDRLGDDIRVWLARKIDLAAKRLYGEFGRELYIDREVVSGLLADKRLCGAGIVLEPLNGLLVRARRQLVLTLRMVA